MVTQPPPWETTITVTQLPGGGGGGAQTRGVLREARGGPGPACRLAEVAAGWAAGLRGGRVCQAP